MKLMKTIQLILSDMLGLLDSNQSVVMRDKGSKKVIPNNFKRFNELCIEDNNATSSVCILDDDDY